MQGVTRVGNRAVKHDAREVLERQGRFMQNHAGVSPHNWQLNVSFSELSYDWVEGQLVQRLDDLELAAFTVWGPSQGFSHQRARSLYQYWAYVIERHSVGMGASASCVGLLELERAFGLVRPQRLTWALDVHGDLTAENALIEQGTGRVVLIDAGSDRLRCRELDYGKIAQSAFSPWEDRQLTMSDALRTKLETVEVQVMELTHWVRLLAHPDKWRDPNRVMKVARDRVAELARRLR